VYTYLFDKLEKRRYPRRPLAVPLADIAYKTGMSYNQIRNRIKKLVELGKIETWTVKHPTQFKITYFRIVNRY